MKKILITGAGGQLGRQWVQFLDRQLNYSYYSFDSSGMDITDSSQVERILNDLHPDVLINCAAYTDVDSAEGQREAADRVNHLAVRHLAGLSDKMNIKLIHFSTDYVFSGDKKDKKHLPNGYPEEHKKDPVNWYGQTKWEGEKTIQASDCSYLVIRLSWLCGEFGSNFVKTMLKLADGRDELRVVDDQWGSPTFIHDVVKNTFELIEQEVEGTYHLTSEGLISWADFAEEIFKIADKNINLKKISSDQYPTKARRPSFSKLDTRKIRQIEGVELPNWKTGLRQLLEKL